MVLNSAFIFVKPHANTEKARNVTRDFLKSKNLEVKSEGLITGKEIDEKNLVDNHYYSIASKATLSKPSELAIPVAKFKEKFGIDWDASKAYNAKDACEHLKVTAEQLDKIWAQAKANKNLVKFGGGFYCGKIELEGFEPIFVINGFFMQMRSKYVKEGCSLYYFVAEWESDKLSWADFRGELLGSTDPVTAPETSLRGQFFKNWQQYGLAAEPDVGDNAIHASASPFEALCEKLNWLGIANAEEEAAFGEKVMKLVSKKVFAKWKLDPQVTFGVAPCLKTQSLFDTVEDTNSDYCLFLLHMIAVDAKDSEYRSLKTANEKLQKERNSYKPIERAADELWNLMDKRGKAKVAGA